MVEQSLSHWAQWIGLPKYILVDAGTSFSGSTWGYVSNTSGCAIITAPPEAHFQVGRVERNLQALKRSFSAIQEKRRFLWTTIRS